MNALQYIPMSQKKVLIIEDSKDLADSLEDIVVLLGHAAITAIDGHHGLLMATVEKPDLILLDLKLPDINGYEVYRQLRADAWGKDARILILTASDVSELPPDDIEIDHKDILHKSGWGIKEIAERIETELSQQ